MPSIDWSCAPIWTPNRPYQQVFCSIILSFYNGETVLDLDFWGTVTFVLETTAEISLLFQYTNTERPDRAGVELAKSLIDSTAGHRPVNLAGFGLGARGLYSCLKALARYQQIWEAHQSKKKAATQKETRV